MKRKKTPGTTGSGAVDVPSAASGSGAAVVPEASARTYMGLSKWDWVTLVLFLAFTLVASTITIGRVSNIAMLLCLVFSIRKSSIANLREHFSLPVIGLVGMVLVYGVSGIYSPFGETAVLELFRGLCMFAIAGFVLLRFRREHVPALLWGLVIVVTVISILSLDAASTRVLFAPVAELAQRCDVDMMRTFPAVSNGRLNGIFNNSNVLAGMTGMTMLIGLYHIQSGETRKYRFWAALLLGINAMAFFLSLSRGAILCFGVSLLVYLLLTKKGQRVRLFMLMFFSALVTMGLSMVVMPVMALNSPLVDLSALLCGPIIFALDELLSRRLGAFLSQHGKVLALSGGVLAVLAVVYVIAGVSVTRPYTFNRESVLNRAVDLAPGSYTLTVDMDEGVTMDIIIRDKDRLMMTDWTTVYKGDSPEGTFEIPENTGRIWVQFRGTDGAQVRSCVMSDGTEVKLDYPLLPATVADRLQDELLSSRSFLLRVQYVVDAMKIWATSPLIGRGLTSTDNLYTAVQPYFYQSKFVHNHIVQYLADTGLVGVAFFLMIVGGLVWLLLRKWKQDRDPVAAMFLACLVMMNLHSLMEINFSLRAYGIEAYFLMAVMTLAYGEPLWLKGKTAVKRAAAGAAVAFWAFIAVFAGVCISYRVVHNLADKYETDNLSDFMETVERFVTYDALDDDYYKILYIARGQGNSHYYYNVRKYAAALQKSGAFTNCDAVARYYYLPQGKLGELFACSMEGIRQKASDQEAWNTELDFYRAKVLTTMEEDWSNARKPFIIGVVNFCNELAAYNEGRMEPIELTEENQQFVDAVMQVWKSADMSAEDSYALLSQFSEAESEK